VADHATGAKYPAEIETAIVRAIRAGDLIAAAGRVGELIATLHSWSGPAPQLGARLCVSLEHIRQAARHGFGPRASEVQGPSDFAEGVSAHSAASDILEAFSAAAHEILDACNGAGNVGTVAELAKARFDNHYADPDLTLKSVAAGLDCNEQYLVATFGEAYGTPPGTYLRSLRIDHAKKLLATTTLPVAEIARRCGYSSASGFRRAFRRVTGLSPSAFRAQARGNDPGDDEATGPNVR